MATHTAPFGLLAPSPRTAPQQPGRRNAGQMQAQPASHVSWLERLAAWADRQPMHHRLGSWTQH